MQAIEKSWAGPTKEKEDIVRDCSELKSIAEKQAMTVMMKVMRASWPRRRGGPVLVVWWRMQIHLFWWGRG